MLTDTDTHYLVGLLTRVPEGTDVIVELGDMVYDKAANKKRDVDVTVSRTNEDGTRSVYKGVEVKNHHRPLDVAKVEQLCLKLDDMPDITHRSIVSASGYTSAAVTKAESHGVELLEIVDWPNPREGFNVQFDADSALTFIEHEWVDGPHIRVNVSETDAVVLSKGFDKNLEVITADGKPYPNGASLGDLSEHAHKVAGLRAQQDTDPVTVKHKEMKAYVIRVNFDETPYIRLGNKNIAIEGIVVNGSLGYIVHDKPIFKILRRYGETKPLTGCAMIELTNHNLMGISVSNLNNFITHLNIPYADRVKKKIRSQRI